MLSIPMDDSDLTAEFSRQLTLLYELADRLGVPAFIAVPIAEEVIYASLLRKPSLDVDRYLSAAFTAAVREHPL